MKTRIIQTKFWTDPVILDINMESKHLFIYLLSCSHIGMTGVFELADSTILYESGLTVKQLSNAKRILTEKQKVYFHNSWIKLVNACKYNNYGVGEKNKPAYEKELSFIPPPVLDYFNNIKDSSIIVLSEKTDTTPIVPIIHNTEIIIQNTSLESVRTFLNYFNQVFGTRYTSTDALLPNFEYWIKQYTLDDLKKAINYARSDKYWRDKMTPEILLRQKDPRGERVDRIGRLINSREALKITNKSLIDEIEAYGNTN